MSYLRTAIAVVVAAHTTSAFGSEGGQTHYPVGVNTIMNAALPAPDSTGFYSYSQYYEASRLNDSNGKPIDSNFRVNVQAEAPRLVHTWNAKIGPFFVASAVITPITRVEIRAFGRHDSSVGFGDPVISPVYLYHVNKKGNFFVYFGPDIYIPVGKYDKVRLANNAAHYWAIAPNASASWLPTSRTEISTTIYSEFNWKNNASEYRSGNSIAIDAVVAYRLVSALPKVKIALQGYAQKQISNDYQNGVIVGDGNRGRVFALGPQVSYDIAGGRGGILLKWQKEFAAQNRAEGNRLWFELAFPI